jgi:hypothetical protein
MLSTQLVVFGTVTMCRFGAGHQRFIRICYHHLELQCSSEMSVFFWCILCNQLTFHKVPSLGLVHNNIHWGVRIVLTLTEDRGTENIRAKGIWERQTVSMAFTKMYRSVYSISGSWYFYVIWKWMWKMFMFFIKIFLWSPNMEVIVQHKMTNKCLNVTYQKCLYAARCEVLTTVLHK